MTPLHAQWGAACDHLDSPAGRWTCLAILAVVAIVGFAFDARKGSPS